MGEPLLVRQLDRQRQFQRHLEHGHRRDPAHRARPRGRTPRRPPRPRVAGDDRHEQPAVLERERRPVGDRGADGRRQGLADHAPPVEHVAGQPEDDPAETGPAGERVLHEDDQERDARRDPAEHGEQGPVDAAPPPVGPRAERDLVPIVPSRPQPHDRRVRDRERKRRTEGVERADELDVPGRMTRIGAMPAKTTSESTGVFSRGCSRRKISGICRYVAIEYVIREAPITPAFVATTGSWRRAGRRRSAPRRAPSPRVRGCRQGPGSGRSRSRSPPAAARAAW